jgi:hypothetical protein
MSVLGYDIQKLKENEVAGHITTNAIIDFILGMRPVSEFLFINPNGRGSVNIDLDFESLLGQILQAVDAMFGGVGEDFKMTVTNNGVSVAGGRVFWTDSYADIQGASFGWSTTDDIIYIKLTSLTSGTLEQGNVTHTVRTTNNEMAVTLPLAKMVKDSNNNWSLHYFHRGSYVFVDEPYFLKPNWQKSKAQTLDHRANENGYRWVSYTDCDASSSN